MHPSSFPAEVGLFLLHNKMWAAWGGSMIILNWHTDWCSLALLYSARMHKRLALLLICLQNDGSFLIALLNQEKQEWSATLSTTLPTNTIHTFLHQGQNRYDGGWCMLYSFRTLKQLQQRHQFESGLWHGWRRGLIYMVLLNEVSLPTLFGKDGRAPSLWFTLQKI